MSALAFDPFKEGRRTRSCSQTVPSRMMRVSTACLQTWMMNYVSSPSYSNFFVGTFLKTGLVQSYIIRKFLGSNQAQTVLFPWRTYSYCGFISTVVVSLASPTWPKYVSLLQSKSSSTVRQARGILPPVADALASCNSCLCKSNFWLWKFNKPISIRAALL
jgi:hypothetical protein